MMVPGSHASRAMEILREFGREVTSAELGDALGIASNLVNPMLRHAVGNGQITRRVVPGVGKRTQAMWGLADWSGEESKHLCVSRRPLKTTGVRWVFDLAEAL
jgi:hypothetical protein